MRHAFSAHTNRSTMQETLSQIFIWQEPGTSRNHIEKEPEKPHPKLKKCKYQIFTENICFSCNPMEVTVFCNHVLSL